MTAQDEVASDWSSPIWPRRLRALLLAGFVLILVGVGILTIATVLNAGASTDISVVIFIGPIPIVMNAGLDPRWTTAIAIALAMVTVVMFLIMRKRPSVENQEMRS